jgi:putative Mg2+ transporter-C (MgtC) family protein
MDAGDQLILVGRVAAAAALGSLVGIEREYRGKAAGDRTFALLALASAAFVAMGLMLFPASGDRVVQGVATGVGFIGAGIIFRGEGGVKGLTTAAASYGAAAMGAVAGAGLLVAAAIAALIVLVLEAPNARLRERLHRNKPPPSG